MKNHKGFSLIELMIVIFIFSVISSMGMFYFLHTLNKRKLVYASRMVYCAVVSAKAEAINRGENIKIQFKPSDESYKAVDSSGLELFSHKFKNGVKVLRSFGSSSDSNFSFIFDCRGLKKGVNGSVMLSLNSAGKSGEFRRVRVTTAGGVSIQRSLNGRTWE